MVRKGEAEKYRKLADFSGKTVAVLRGASFFPEFDASPSVVRYEVSLEENALKMLVLGRVDAVAMTKENSRYLLMRMNDVREGVEYADYRHQSKVEVYFAISRRSPFLVWQAELEAALRKMLDSGEVRRILETVPE